MQGADVASTDVGTDVGVDVVGVASQMVQIKTLRIGSLSLSSVVIAKIAACARVLQQHSSQQHGVGRAAKRLMSAQSARMLLPSVVVDHTAESNHPRYLSGYGYEY